MSRKWILPLILLTVICISVGCNYSDDPSWSGNLDQTIGVTGTYWIVTTPNSILNSFTFTQMENVVDAVDNLGGTYEGSATQDLVVAESDPSHPPEDDISYYARTISVTITGTLPNGASVTLILTPIYSGGTFAQYLVTPTTANIIVGLNGEYVDSNGVTGYIEMWKYGVDPFATTTTT